MRTEIYAWAAGLFGILCAALLVYRPETWLPALVIWLGVSVTLAIADYRGRK